MYLTIFLLQYETYLKDTFISISCVIVFKMKYQLFLTNFLLTIRLVYAEATPYKCKYGF